SAPCTSPLEIHKVGLGGPVNQLFTHRRFDAKIVSHVHNLVEQVARVIGAQLALGLDVILLEQVAQRLFVEVEAAHLGDAPEYLPVIVEGRRGDLDLVSDAPQERLVHQVAGRQVGGKDEQQLERHFQLLACVQGEEVYVLFHGDDPAVEQVARANLLPAEVVDEEQPAVGLHLEGRLVEFVNRIVLQIQTVQRQFAADHDDGPVNPDPARVAAVAAKRPRGTCPFLLHRRMVDAIVKHDDLPVGQDGVGHVDVIAQDHAANAFGDGSFAVTRRAVEKDRATGVDRRANLGEDVLVQYEVGERLAHHARIHLQPPAALGANGGYVVGPRDRGSARVGRPFQFIP